MNEVYVLIPAINEEKSISKVIENIPVGFVKEVIVVDNGSEDNTVSAAEKSGAVVLLEPVRGYGAACLKGLEYIFGKCDDGDVVVFLDGDYSDYPEEMKTIAGPVLNEKYDLVIGSRILGRGLGLTEKNSLLPQAIFGNRLSAALIKFFWKYEFTDLGPFRAVKACSLKKMKMNDMNYGWTVEMQIKAAKLKMKCKEVPVSYRRRIGISKVTGTVSGSVKAGVKILYTIFRSL
ncbi:MAG: glycosyltransferase family 2 protein [Ignavibacteria bacterium]|nr:glycosyltransferase family 2 protein [Ignavibacteria bacterium]